MYKREKKDKRVRIWFGVSTEVRNLQQKKLRTCSLGNPADTLEPHNAMLERINYGRS